MQTGKSLKWKHFPILFGACEMQPDTNTMANRIFNEEWRFPLGIGHFTLKLNVSLVICLFLCDGLSVWLFVSSSVALSLSFFISSVGLSICMFICPSYSLSPSLNILFDVYNAVNIHWKQYSETNCLYIKDSVTFCLHQHKSSESRFGPNNENIKVSRHTAPSPHTKHHFNFLLHFFLDLLTPTSPI